MRRLLPADAELQELGRRVHAEAGVGRVDFYGIVEVDDHVTWCVIYQDGPRRATVQLPARPAETDVADISTALRSWVRYRAQGSAYTTEVPREPISEWS